mmetsp:Transcript_37471/g.97818  ORF Transcript_37471/g.97818 Transcript_37471/m.97818 type:complete len:207 (+) Transcript_37471:169-789(+)
MHRRKRRCKRRTTLRAATRSRRPHLQATRLRPPRRICPTSRPRCHRHRQAHMRKPTTVTVANRSRRLPRQAGHRRLHALAQAWLRRRFRRSHTQAARTRTTTTATLASCSHRLHQQAGCRRRLTVIQPWLRRRFHPACRPRRRSSCRCQPDRPPSRPPTRPLTLARLARSRWARGASRPPTSSCRARTGCASTQIGRSRACRGVRN